MYGYLSPENLLALSTSDSPPRNLFVSAQDAVHEFLRLQNRICGLQAIDYERAAERVGVSSSRGTIPTGPCSDSVDILHDLRCIFRAVSESVEPDWWRVWCCIRVNLDSQKKVSDLSGFPRRKVSDILRTIDELIVSKLIDSEMFCWISD